MPFRLPPLNTLRLFEAAGRHRSFKLAAEELHVTPSAVSHGVQRLEEWLGTALFHRGSRGLTLTPAGETFLASVSEALSLLAGAAERVAGRKATGTLSLSVAPTFASRWLLPRLPHFTGRHPGIAVTIDTDRRQVEFPRDGVDLAIRMSPGPGAGATWVRLVSQTLLPVCAPPLRHQLGGGGLAAQLGGAPLLHVTGISEDWDRWFKAAGVPAPERQAGLRFDTIQLALEAAIRGLGIALGRKPLIDDDLASGRLVALDAAPIASASGVWLVGAESVFDRPEIRLFRKWILEELASAAPPPASGTPSAPAPSIPGR